MFTRIAPVVGLACFAVSLHGCGSGGTTTTAPSPTPPTTPAPTPTPPAPTLINGTCNADSIAAGIEDCDRVDFGSCGNACCKITTAVSLSPADVAHALNTSLANGGADGHYELQPLVDSPFGFTPLEPDLPGAFMGQVYHTTSGPGHYTDVVNILIEPSGSAGTASTISAFSLPLIGGALGDSGQSYKNIIMALKGANLAGWSDTLVSNVGGSCPAPTDKNARLARRDGAKILGHRRLDAVEGTCGLDPDVIYPANVTIPDCKNWDTGSCGNACCSLTVTVSMSPSDAVSALNNSLDDGGLDGQFTKQDLAEKTVGFADITGGPPAAAAAFGFGSGPVYIGQVHHATSGPAHYVDVLNFNIVEGANGSSTIQAFSTSLAGAALGDVGQNYKNLMMALSVFNGSSTIAPGNFEMSCLPCHDNRAFIDATGYGCADWSGYPCTVYDGYTDDDIAAVQENCPATCGGCGGAVLV